MSHIDVMVTCFNYGHFLRECVESVLAQSHRDLRMVIVDDASTDDTSAVCDELAARDSRVEILRHPVNRGHIPTYNECIAMARDDYLLVLSADDFLLPGALARAIEVLDAQPDVGLAHGAWVMYRAGESLPDPAGDSSKAELLDAAWFIERLAVDNYVCTATAIVRTATQKRLGGYRGELPHAGDLEMWLRFALHSKVAYVPEPQAAYRRHDGNMSLSYGPVPDLQQRSASFQLHYRDIRRRLPDGMMVEARIRRQLAILERNIAHHLLRHDRAPTLLLLFARSLRGRLHARLLELRARYRPQTQLRSRPKG
jgi:glycosyltransferase involved in cell wall biosynthesis